MNHIFNPVMSSTPQIFEAYPVTGSVATAAAALLEGSIFPEADSAAEKWMEINGDIYREILQGVWCFGSMVMIDG